MYSSYRLSRLANRFRGAVVNGLRTSYLECPNVRSNFVCLTQSKLRPETASLIISQQGQYDNNNNETGQPNIR